MAQKLAAATSSAWQASYFAELSYFFPNNCVTISSELLRAVFSADELALAEQCVAVTLGGHETSLFDVITDASDEDDDEQHDDKNNNNNNNNNNNINDDDDEDDANNTHSGVYELRSFDATTVYCDKPLAALLYRVATQCDDDQHMPASFIPNNDDEHDSDDDHYAQARYVAIATLL
jgi:hypothetical protein